LENATEKAVGFDPYSADAVTEWPAGSPYHGECTKGVVDKDRDPNCWYPPLSQRSDSVTTRNSLPPLGPKFNPAPNGRAQDTQVSVLTSGYGGSFLPCQHRLWVTAEK